MMSENPFQKFKEVRRLYFFSILKPPTKPAAGQCAFELYMYRGEKRREKGKRKKNRSNFQVCWCSVKILYISVFTVTNSFALKFSPRSTFFS